MVVPRYGGLPFYCSFSLSLMRNDGIDYLKQKELAFLRAPEFEILDFRTLSNGNPPLLLLLL